MDVENVQAWRFAHGERLEVSSKDWNFEIFQVKGL